jgi:4-hydroxybutyryl-CoA dehydratase/vinylacetyl-CoA-Delta-isomerase
MKYLQDITGGIAATLPSQGEWDNPETRPYLEKYLQGSADFSTEDRLKAIDSVIRLGSTFNGVLSIHAEGSLATQRMVIYQMADWDKFKAAAQRSLGIPTDHPAFKDSPTEAPWRMSESLLNKK